MSNIYSKFKMKSLLRYEHLSPDQVGEILKLPIVSSDDGYIESDDCYLGGPCIPKIENEICFDEYGGVIDSPGTYTITFNSRYEYCGRFNNTTSVTDTINTRDIAEKELNLLAEYIKQATGIS